uniref:glutamate synthase n=1 Tax=Galdieria phlegrea TaxID=1389228 RepID=UPI0023D8B555|nr:glutamate synthase [Galdieria phlegrea]WDA99845.1 glutamate synthase [Galdieria phlegrea]
MRKDIDFLIPKISKNFNSYQAQPWLIKERDACGVGFIASIDNIVTHKLIMQAIEALIFMEHRGACSADKSSGDGAGIMTSIPWKLFERYIDKSLDRKYIGVGMCFLPQNLTEQKEAKKFIEWILKEESLELIAWREVPTNNEVLGIQAYQNKPSILQFFVKSSLFSNLERKLYITRRRIENLISKSYVNWLKEFYICSLSSKIIVYKGMVKSAVLAQFYQDLLHLDYESSFAIYHRRFSTNTMPKWALAQPMRLIAHNGEINTLLGNLNWMKTREELLTNVYDSNDLNDIKPICNPENSDSANLDNAFELLLHSNLPIQEVSLNLIPEAYKNNPDISLYPDIINFYEYNSMYQEAWDGPALVIFSDGKVVGASLDRNGLRPARFCITQDNYIIVASESGVINIDQSNIIKKGRIGPGQIIALDIENKVILQNIELKRQIAKTKNYDQLLNLHRLSFSNLDFIEINTKSETELLQWQTLFGYTSEDVELTIEHMSSQGKEPTFCMGDDIPLAILSGKPHILYNYFKQRFAQVTNPAIDPLRESLVMSLDMYVGNKEKLFNSFVEGKIIHFNSPIINEQELEKIYKIGLKTEKIKANFNITKNTQELKSTLLNLCQKAENLVKSGVEILVITDNLNFLSSECTYIPPLLITGSIHHHLIRKKIRHKASIIVETAQAWNTHHFACLIGYGANLICPYLVLETVRHWWHNAKTQNLMQKNKIPTCTIQEAQNNYKKAVENGLLKILSKMGISLLSSYQGAQIFEILGLGTEIINLAFTGSISRIGGLSFSELANEIIIFHNLAFKNANKNKLNNYGFIQYRPGCEYHLNNPDMAKTLHKAVRTYKTEFYEGYKNLLYNRPPTNLRDLLQIRSDKMSISISDVESAHEIVKRFCTGGMSLGALSREAHETLAIAMNRLGGKSNSGEGGEDSVRFKILSDVDLTGHSPLLSHLKGLANGDTANSAIKQIASGRFGVTPEYIMNAHQLEIKIAQGAKPGEGGQLPGKKVSPYIAKLRACKPGVPLISPPPHHDIYSIEDLSQLIFDLHQINPKAKVSVKLVASVGIGTIAAGVAKANADIIQISGHDGGTGASPLSSIKHAGIPWELGLSEVNKALLLNNLRDRVLLRVDGGLKTGLDIVLASLMGAEEYGFGTVAMIATGCIMARICHTNNCPVGVASQREDLRARYPGVPEALVNFCMFIAEEVRSIIAYMGYSSLNEIIGRYDLLTQNCKNKLVKTKNLDLHYLLNLPKQFINDRSWLLHEDVHSNGPVLDDILIKSADIEETIMSQLNINKHLKILNINRAVGGRLSGYIAKKYGNNKFKGKINLNFYGSAGQSFGLFNIQGLSLRLIGEANDYVGKGMNGGEIIIIPNNQFTKSNLNNVIIGNTCLYGATGGYLFVRGEAGERFAVRNSQAKAVVEGVGDHCCEYMTGGVVVVLGKTGRNFAAGMTGGLAYVFDKDNDFIKYLNPEIVKIQRVITKSGEIQLKSLLEQHLLKTGSLKAKEILENWSLALNYFWQIVPPSEADTAQTNPNVDSLNLSRQVVIK